jgi:hypothetical protein
MANVTERPGDRVGLVLEGDIEGSFAAVHVSWVTSQHRRGSDR